MSSDERLGSETGGPATSVVLFFGPFSFDITACRLSREGVEIHLTPKAAAVFCYLLQKPGELISKDEFLEVVWEGVHVREESLTQAISVIRQVLGDSAQSPRYIQTVSGEGYRFVGAVTSEKVPTAPTDEGRIAAGVTSTRPAVTQEPTDVASSAEPTRSSSRERVPRRTWEAWLRGLTTVAAAVVVLGLLALAAGWIGAAGDSATGEPMPGDAPRIVPLTFDGGRKENPELSPDGNFVAFDWEGPDGDNRDIWVKQIDSDSPPRRITTDPARDIGAVWSPDGTAIAFLRIVDGRATIYRVPAPLGGEETKLKAVEGWFSLAQYLPFVTLDWSPDGRFIAYSERPTREEPAHVMLLEVATLEATELLPPPEVTGDGIIGDTRPRFSPNGRSVAFVRSSSSYGGYDLWVVDIEGRAPRRITWESWLHCYEPAWMPDGRELLVDAGTLHMGRTYRVDLDGGEPRLVDGLGRDDVSPHVVGERLVFSDVTRNQRETWSKPGRLAEERDVPARPVIQSIGFNANHDISPDSTKIAFESTRTGTNQIWIANIDGTDPRQLTDVPIVTVGPRWSPDGKLISFFGTHLDPGRESGARSQQEIYVVEVETRRWKRLTHHPADDCCSTFSRDGNWIYFASNRDGPHRLYKMPVEGLEAGQDPIPVTSGDGYYGIESYDGKYLYYSKYLGFQKDGEQFGIWRVPTNGGEEAEFFFERDLFWFPDFDLVERGLYYGLRANGRFRVLYLDFETGETQQVFQEDGGFIWLRVSPDERTVLYSKEKGERKSEVVLVENFR